MEDKIYYIIWDKRSNSIYSEPCTHCLSLYDKIWQAQREINHYEPDYRKNFEIREYKLVKVKL